MAEAEITSKGGSSRAAASVRTAGEPSRPARPGRATAGSRPRSAASRTGISATGTGARLLAPLALIVCVIAVLAVLSGGGSETVTRGETSGSQTSSKSDSDSNASGGSPAATAATGPVRSTYRVKPGDSFAAIAEKTGVDVDALAELNPDVDPRALQPGQKLKLK